MLGGGLDVFKLPSTVQTREGKADKGGAGDIESSERYTPEYVARAPSESDIG